MLRELEGLVGIKGKRVESEESEEGQIYKGGDERVSANTTYSPNVHKFKSRPAYMYA